MKLWSSLAVACLVVVSAAAAEKPADPKLQEKLVGKWEASEGEIKGAVFEFGKTGDLKLTIKLGDNKIELGGKYKVASEDMIEMTIKGPDGKEQTEKLTYKFDKEVLSITGPDKKTIKFMKQK